MTEEENNELSWWRGLGIAGAIGFIVIAVLLAGCQPVTQSAGQKQAARVENQLAQAEMSVPPPRVSNFTQLRDATTIIEMADQNFSTWAYYMDMHGKLHFLCEAKGYGLPYSTQTTNPMRSWKKYDVGGELPQAEPSGLFMPDNVAATWVLCVNDEGQFDPVYWEPDLVVSPFPLAYETSLKAP